MQAKFGTAPRIQLNDSYKTTKDILDFVAAERDKLSEADRASMTICLKADQTTKMGIVTDVKQELRRANALKVSYAASKSLLNPESYRKRAEVGLQPFFMCHTDSYTASSIFKRMPATARRQGKFGPGI